MTLPRATSDESDELAATISGLKSRLNELESAAGYAVPPIGTILDFIGSSAPSGWAILDGSTITNGRTLYPLLWDVLPSGFKSGNNIVLPDTRGRVTVHQGGSAFTGSLGSKTGVESVTLDVSQMPSHRHSTEFYRTQDSPSNGYGLTITGGFANRVMVYTSDDQDLFINDTGGGGSHTNVQPSFVVVKIMKLG